MNRTRKSIGAMSRMWNGSSCSHSRCFVRAEAPQRALDIREVFNANRGGPAVVNAGLIAVFLRRVLER